METEMIFPLIGWLIVIAGAIAHMREDDASWLSIFANFALIVAWFFALLAIVLQLEQGWLKVLVILIAIPVLALLGRGLQKWTDRYEY